ncbi:hypothetical protein XENTR_v10005593 [Xenopus tropicalis]|nr:hypothetical protein XENTR_v10005593 [Xenopus tropicalis]
MVQGMEAKLEFEQLFPYIKAQAATYKDQSSASIKSCDVQRPRKTDSRDSDATCPSPSTPSPETLRDCLSQLERDFIQFKEEVERQQGVRSHGNEQIREEISKMRSEHKATLLEVQSSVQQLQ